MSIDKIQGYIERSIPKPYVKILSHTQKYVNEHCWEAYSSNYSKKDLSEKVMSFINKYLLDNQIKCSDIDNLSLTKKLYYDINEFSTLTDYLDDETVEEINVNAWNNVWVLYSSGQIAKIENFANEQQAVDIIKKLMLSSNITVDKGQPIGEAHIGANKRIATLISPLVDDAVGVACSIRRLSQNIFSKEQYLSTDFSSENELNFIESCLRYGVSMIVAGRVKSGKTTFENFLLDTIPNNKRIYTIESGARELNLVKFDENGEVVNNVVHTITRPSDVELENITQEKLVRNSLRFDPDYICVAEMRDVEAYAGQEASLTGHTVITSLHAGGARQAHSRIAALCRKLYPIEYQTALLQACEAFPIVVYIHQTEDYVRRIMDVSEVVVDGVNITYRSLFRYEVQSNDLIDGKTVVTGSHKAITSPSKQLISKLINGGMPLKLLKKYEVANE